MRRLEHPRRRLDYPRRLKHPRRRLRERLRVLERLRAAEVAANGLIRRRLASGCGG